MTHCIKGDPVVGVTDMTTVQLPGLAVPLMMMRSEAASPHLLNMMTVISVEFVGHVARGGLFISATSLTERLRSAHAPTPGLPKTCNYNVEQLDQSPCLTAQFRELHA